MTDVPFRPANAPSRTGPAVPAAGACAVRVVFRLDRLAGPGQRHTCSMSTCACAPSHRTTVAFSHGIVLQRCRLHDLQTWTLDGRATDAPTVRGLLKDLFVEARGARTRSTSPLRRRASAPLRAAVPTEVPRDVALGAGADEALTALLRSRGVQGSWSVAAV